MSEENRNALRCGYESETGKRHWENPVCHGEIAYASHAYQLFLEDLVISCEEELRRAHEEHDKLCDSLALVNEKDAEIERLKNDIKLLTAPPEIGGGTAAYLLEKLGKVEAELTRLKAEIGQLHIVTSAANAEEDRLKKIIDNLCNERDAAHGEIVHLKAGERELLVYLEFLETFWGIPDRVHLNPRTTKAREYFLASREKQGEKG
jgi:hypothetical protein